MARKGCTPDECDKFMQNYAEPLLKTDLWKELIIADPGRPAKFIPNLIELFEKENFNQLSTGIGVWF